MQLNFKSQLLFCSNSRELGEPYKYIIIFLSIIINNINNMFIMLIKYI